MDVYQNYEESQGWSSKSFGSFTSDEDKYFRKEMSKLLVAAQANKNIRLLDIGFGNGAFMGWCRANGIECEGLEINPAQVEKANAAGFTAHLNFDDIHGNKFNSVTGFDVLEHIEANNLVNFLSSVKQICAPQALIFFRFPNGDNPFSLWMQNGDLTHRNFIGSGMITQAAVQANLSIVKIAEPAVAYAGLSLGQKFKIFAGHVGRRMIGKFLVTLFMSGQQNIRFSPNLAVEFTNG